MNAWTNWRGMYDIRTTIEALPNIESLEQAHALVRFYVGSIYPSDYLISDEWEELVVATESGQSYLKLENGLLTDFTQAERHFILYCSFYHHDLLIDVDKSNLKRIKEILNEDLRLGKIRLPLIFGRQLYDKFNDVCTPQWIDHVPAGEASHFLNATSQGIFQVGTLVSGPLGIIESRQKRSIPPQTTVQLWHCSDSGCRAVHAVRLHSSHLRVRDVIQKLEAAAVAAWGPASPWDKELTEISEGSLDSRIRTYYDIVAIIAECIFDEERTLLLQRALRSEFGTFVRKLLDKSLIDGSGAKGTPQEIAQRLTPEEQLQVLFALTDSELVGLVDRSIFDQSISLPPNENRSSRLSLPKRYFSEKKSTLSSLGAREEAHEPLVSLCFLIWQAYSKHSSATELAWRIRDSNGIATQETLMQYLRVATPEDSITKLVLSSGPITKAVVEELQYYGSLESPDIVAHLLWKIGFEVPRYSDIYERLRGRLQSFSEAVLEVGKVRTENDREIIRSAGVNLFVSIEQVLDEIVSYNVWLLSSDHFVKTDFMYDVADARKSVSETLGEALSSGDSEFRWNEAGVNTLGTLYRYLQEANRWVRELLAKERDAFLRPVSEIPHYAGKAGKLFPFYHTPLWANVSPSCLAAYFEDFSSLVKKLDQANPTQIRNGLDHQRREADFPEADAMLAFIAKFREAFDHADLQRYLPKEYWAVEQKQDRYSRYEHTFRDYRERNIIVYSPVASIGTRKLDLKHPILIAPNSLLGQHTNLTFGIRDISGFSEYWKGYPRRRNITKPES